MNLFIIKIQKQVRIFLLKKKLYNFKKLELNKKANNLDFDNFSKLLKNKEIISITEQLINYLSLLIKKNKISSRKILTAFLINYFSDEIFGKEKNFSDIMIIKWSYYLINILDNKINNYNDIIKLFNFINNYSNIITQWLNKDKNQTIENIIISYKYRCDHIDKIISDISINNENKTNMIKELNIQKKDLLKNILLIDKNFDINYLEKNYNKIYKNLENGYNNILNKLNTNMKKAFYDILVKDIENHKIDIIVKNFQEIGNRLLQICPIEIKTSFIEKFNKHKLIDIFINLEWNDKVVNFIKFIIDSIIIFNKKNNNLNKWKTYINLLLLNNYEKNLPLIIIKLNEKIDEII